MGRENEPLRGWGNFLNTPLNTINQSFFSEISPSGRNISKKSETIFISRGGNGWHMFQNCGNHALKSSSGSGSLAWAARYNPTRYPQLFGPSGHTICFSSYHHHRHHCYLVQYFYHHQHHKHDSHNHHHHHLIHDLLSLVYSIGKIV